MARSIVSPRWQAHAQASADMAPVVRRDGGWNDALSFDSIDRFEDGLDPRPAAEIQQDLGAGGDEGIGGERLPGSNRAQDRDMGLDRAVFAVAPADETKDRARREFDDAATAIDDPLARAAAKPDPAFDLSFQPKEVHLRVHPSVSSLREARAEKAGARAA